MAKDAQIRARVDAELKEEAEEVLDSLGLTPSAAINMYYRQIVHRRAIPFAVALPGAAAESAAAAQLPAAAGQSAAAGQAALARQPARVQRPGIAPGAPGAPAGATQPAYRPHDRLTYGDFPHLFWNAEPGAPLDLDDASTFARFLTRGDPETVFRVVTLDEIARRLPDLALQPETRTFWERVVRAGASG